MKFVFRMAAIKMKLEDQMLKRQSPKWAGKWQKCWWKKPLICFMMISIHITLIAIQSQFNEWIDCNVKFKAFCTECWRVSFENIRIGNRVKRCVNKMIHYYWTLFAWRLLFEFHTNPFRFTIDSEFRK